VFGGSHKQAEAPKIYSEEILIAKELVLVETITQPKI